MLRVPSESTVHVDPSWCGDALRAALHRPRSEPSVLPGTLARQTWVAIIIISTHKLRIGVKYVSY